MTMELNIFNIARQPQNRDNKIVDVDWSEELVDYIFPPDISDDILQTRLNNFDLYFDIDDQSTRSMPYLIRNHLWIPINGKK